MNAALLKQKLLFGLLKYIKILRNMLKWDSNKLDVRRFITVEISFKCLNVTESLGKLTLVSILALANILALVC